MFKFTGYRAKFLTLLFCCLPLCTFASEGLMEEHGGGMTDRMMRLAIQIGLILFAAKIGNVVFERLKLPGVLGEICAGIVIGPYALGGINVPFLRGFEQGLFFTPPDVAVSQMAVSPELYGLCSVASIVLLFVVGLETDLKLFLRYIVVGSVVGIGGVLASFITGDLIGIYFLSKIFPNDHYTFFHPACIFLGVMSTATSVSITARILSERKKMKTPEGVTILSGAVIDDVFGVILLAIGIGIAKSEVAAGQMNWHVIGRGAAQTITVWIAATATAVLFSRWISSGLKRFGSKTAISIMALGLTMIVAGFFEEARLAMIIGAYVMGLALSRTDISHAIRENLHPIATFLVPIFFTVMGMLVDVRPIFSTTGQASFYGLPIVLVFGLVYTVLAILAKLLGCGLPLLACGFKLRGAMRVGIGMVPRGEVALIVAGVGLSGGFLSQEVFTVAILMTLLTTIAAPPMLVKVFQSDRRGLRSKAKDADDAPSLTYTLPTPELTKMITDELLHVFEKEGFFVHDLEMGHHNFQVRKDAVSITIEMKDCSIDFFCERHEKSLVQTALTEVIAEIEATLAVLRKPYDLQGIVANQGAPVQVERLKQRLGKYLILSHMFPHLESTTPEGIIREMVAAMAKQGHLSSPEAVIQSVLRREAVMPTGLRDGLAMPHGRTDSVKKLTCAVGICRKGADFQTLDGKLAQIIILVLSPAEGNNAPYMEFIAAVRDAFDDQGRTALLKAETPSQMMAILHHK